MKENETSGISETIVSVSILLIAAAVGYFADYYFMLVLQSDGLSEALNALVAVLPLTVLVVFVQEFAFKVRRGQVAFFRKLTVGQAITNGLFIICIGALLGLVTQRTVIFGGSVTPTLTSYIVLMVTSYGCNWALHYFRKRPM